MTTIMVSANLTQKELVEKIKLGTTPASLELAPVTFGARLIANERNRVIAEHGYTEEHDRSHHNSYDLLMMAELYTKLARVKALGGTLESYHVAMSSWPIPLDRDARYYAVIAGQLLAAVLEATK